MTLTLTETSTNTPTTTATYTNSSTITDTLTPTLTYTPTASITQTLTNSATSTSTSTLTNTTTPTFSVTAIPTSTLTQTPTVTLTSTATVALINCGGVPAWSGNAIVYVMGQEVGYNGQLYECLQINTSQATFPPASEPALWKDLGPCGTTPTQTNNYTNPVIYPNPCPGSETTLQLPEPNAENLTVKIFTLSFREVQTIEINQVSGDSIQIPLYDKGGHPLANGLYYFVIELGGNRWINKVLILR